MKADYLRLPTILLGLLAMIATTASGADAAEDANPASGDLFSFRAEGESIQQALALFARANKLNIVPDLDVVGEVTVEFHDLPLDLAMQALLDASGYYFVKDGPLIRVRNQETRLFEIDYINVVRAGVGSNAVQITSGNSGGSSGGSSAGSSSGEEQGSTMTVTANSNIDFWGDLELQLASMITERGRVSVNGLAGTVMVTDSHRRIEAIADFLKSITESVVRQIDLEVEIYEVQFSNEYQLGVNWSAVADSLNSSIATIPGFQGVLPSGTVDPISSGGGLIVRSPVFGTDPSPAAVQYQFANNSFQAVVEALEEQGDVSVVSKPRLRTLNNQPAVVRVGTDFPVFLRQVTQGTGFDAPIFASETIQTITVGTVLSITPQVSRSGLITLEVTPAVSRLVEIATSASGDTNAPVVDIRQASSIVRLRDGETVIMGGLVQDGESTTERKIPLLGDIPYLGKLFSAKHVVKDKSELVFFLTPRIVADLSE